MIVQAMEAFSIPIAAERSVKAKNKCFHIRRKAKQRRTMQKTFHFFISRNPFFMQQEEAFAWEFVRCFILYMETVKKIKYWLFEKNGKWYIIIRAE